jgi:hypothetical protein
VCVSNVRETGVNMTELGPNLAGPPPRAGHPASHPPADTRPAPHSAPPGLRRADPLRPTKTTKRLDPHDPAPRRKFPRRKSPSPPLGAARRGLAFNKMPHPEETATAAVSKSLPPRRPGDAPAPLPHALVASQAEAPSQRSTPAPVFTKTTHIAPASRPSGRTECPPRQTPPPRHLAAPTTRPMSPRRTGPDRTLPCPAPPVIPAKPFLGRDPGAGIHNLPLA